MEKQCKYCGALLPTEASFCHFCEKSQIEKVPAVLPKPQKRKKALTVCFLLILMVGICWTFLSQDGQLSAEDAAKCGVYLHGLAADHCAQRLGQAYMQPNDILQDMGEILQ